MKTELSNISQGATPQIQESELISYLDSLGLTDKLTEGEKLIYLNIAKAFNLNPFKREIHASKYGDTMSVITGYEVYLKRAERTGLLDGWHATTTGSVAEGNLKGIVTIHRKDRSHPFIWEADYNECVQLTRDGKVTKFWQKGAFMTKKVAISQGFRLCFSDELGGMPYTADEMPDLTEDISFETLTSQTGSSVPNDSNAKIGNPETPTVIVLPEITEKMFGQLITRLKFGEDDVITKAKEKYKFSPEKGQIVNSIMKAKKPNGKWEGEVEDMKEASFRDFVKLMRVQGEGIVAPAKIFFKFSDQQEDYLKKVIASITKKAA